MGKVYNEPRYLAKIVRDVLARGDDRAWTMPQESRGAWREVMVGWRTDPDVTAQLAALTSLDLSEYELCEWDKEEVKHMLSSHCFGCMHMYSVFIPLSVLTHAQCRAELTVCV
jgi:hypothetical protein